MPTDRRATHGFEVPELYDRGRPAFPQAAVDELARALGLDAGSRVLDLGAGTGLFTQTLVGAAGAVVALDASEAMLGALRARLPEVDARLGTAEAIPLEGSSVDAVFAVDAFHWFDTAPAAAEIARVLRPDGWLVLAWHRLVSLERTETPWVARLRELMDTVFAASEAFAGRPHPGMTGQWRADLEATGLFSPLVTTEVDFVQHLSHEDFVALVGSWSWIAVLPEEERSRALDGVREIIGAEDELALEYRTAVHRAQRTA